MHILCLRVDGIGSTHLLRQCQFLIVDVGGNDSGTTQGRAHDGTHTHHATANHHHRVDIRHLCSVHGVEAHTHRLYQGTGTRVESSGRDHFLPGQGDKLPHGAVALHTEGLVVLTGIHPSVAARGALATVRIGSTGHHHPRLQDLRHVGTHLLNDGSYLMTWYHRHLHHRVPAEPCVQVGTTEPHIGEAQQHLVGLQCLFGHTHYFHLAFARNLNCFHSLIFFIYGNTFKSRKPKNCRAFSPKNSRFSSSVNSLDFTTKSYDIL